MFNIGSRIRDEAGNHWIVTMIWSYKGFLCLGLIGEGAMDGQMGGARFRQGEEILVRR